MVKVVEVSDSSQQKTLRGHEAPVLSVTFDPKDDFLVSEPCVWKQKFNAEAEVSICVELQMGQYLHFIATLYELTPQCSSSYYCGYFHLEF